MGTLSLVFGNGHEHIKCKHNRVRLFLICRLNCWLFSGFSIIPHPDWVLQVGVEYDVSVQIYSQDNHKVYITDVRILHVI